MSHSPLHGQTPITYVVMGFLLATVAFGGIFLAASKNKQLYPREIFYMNAYDQDYDGIPPFDDALYNGEIANRRWDCVLRDVRAAQN